MLVDFIVELPQSETRPDSLNWWTLNIDGASRQTKAGIGLHLKSPSGDKIEHAIRLRFNASNNESEYEAILAGLELAAALSVGKLLVQIDSQLVVGQVNEEFESRDPSNGEIHLPGETTLEQFSGLEAGAYSQGL